MDAQLTLNEFQSIHGHTLPVGDIPKAQFLLDLAHARLVARVPSIPARLAAGTLDPTLVKGALYDILARALSMPEPGEQPTTEQFSAGPFQSSRTWSQDRVFVRDNDVRDLLPRSGARVVQMTTPAWRFP